MRLNLEEFKKFIEVFMSYVDVSGMICNTFGINEATIFDELNSFLYDLFVSLCGYDEDFMSEKDPILNSEILTNVDLDPSDNYIKDLYNKVLQEISEYRISKDPNGDMF